MRRMIMAAAGLAAGLGGPAAADWSLSHPDSGFREGAFVCPIDDAETGHVLCFGLACDADGVLDWVVIDEAGGSLGASARVVLTVDGRLAGLLALTRRPGRALNAQHAPVADRAPVAALMAGARATLALRGDYALSLDLSLRGSSRAIWATLGACRG